MDRTVSSSINHFPLKFAARGCCVLWCISIHFPGNPSAAVIFQAEADRARKKQPRSLRRTVSGNVTFIDAHARVETPRSEHIEAPSGKERCNASLTNPAASVFELVPLPEVVVPLPEVASCLVWFEVMSSGLVSRQTARLYLTKTKKGSTDQIPTQYAQLCEDGHPWLSCRVRALGHGLCCK